MDWEEGPLGHLLSAVASKLTVRCRSIDGDGKADLAGHGGADKAVDAYPSEQYGPCVQRRRAAGVALRALCVSCPLRPIPGVFQIRATSPPELECVFPGRRRTLAIGSDG